MREVPWNVVRGFLMGAADIVPGVSGGTVALVVGIYTRFITSIRNGSAALFSFARGRWHEGVDHLRTVDWKLLIPVVAGILLAVLTLARVIEDQLQQNPVEMAAAFLGLVAGSTVIAWRMLQVRDGRRIAIMVVMAVAVFLLLGLREGTSETTVDQIVEPATWAFFAAGAVAICAMVLPGISGSFILVTLGMYGPVLAAVNDRDLGTVAVFGLGTVIGLALFSHVLHKALALHYDSVLAVLIGLMAGSIRVLWPWPRGVESTAIGAPGDAAPLAILLMLGGFAVVMALGAIARRLDTPAGTVATRIEP